MKRLILGVLAGLLVGATGAPAANPTDTPTPQQAAARDTLDASLAPLLSKTFQSAPVRVVRCHPVAHGWYGCRATVTGTSRCRVILRVRPGRTQLGYARRLYCRSR